MDFGTLRVQETGEVMAEYQYRLGFPNTSFAVDRAPPGTDRIVQTEPPATSRYERAVQSGIELVEVEKTVKVEQGEDDGADGSGDVEDVFETVTVGQWQVAWSIEAALVPARIPMRSARRILYRDGLLAPVEAIIASMEGEQGDLARIDWATALTVERTDPLVLHVIPELGKSETEIDHMFIDAELLG